MHVFVNRVGEAQRVVVFRCKAGHGASVARWMGDPLPAQGTDAFVELTVPHPVTEWSPASPTAGRAMEVTADGLVVRGEVLAIGGPEDPVVELRVGTDVVLVEIGDGRDALEVGGRISFKSLILEVHSYDL
uniref:Uncharacterized protein n=1 Tax=Streptomyces sp. NBC_00049 TaxID=2903617 RepID=A0AAU2JPE2_9ACTN